MTLDWTTTRTYAESVYAVTADQALAVAKKYLVPGSFCGRRDRRSLEDRGRFAQAEPADRDPRRRRTAGQVTARMAITLTSDRGRGYSCAWPPDISARVLRRDAREGRRGSRSVRAAEYDRGRTAAAIPGEAGRLPRRRKARARSGARPARLLSLASGSSGAAVAVRSRSRMAVVLLRDRLGDGRRRQTADVVAIEGRSIGVR